jgi:peptidoglycan-N-acetylglucosamine deacetylase
MFRLKPPLLIGALLISVVVIITVILQIPTTELSINNYEEPKNYLESTNNPEITSKITEYKNQKIVMPLVNNEKTDLKIKSDFTELSSKHSNLSYEAIFKSPTLFSIYVVADGNKIPITYDLRSGEHINLNNLLLASDQAATVFMIQNQSEQLENSFVIENNTIKTFTTSQQPKSAELVKIAPYANLNTLEIINPDIARAEYNRREEIELVKVQNNRIIETQDKISNVVNCNLVPCISITFDDGPSEHTARLLDILKDKNVKSTFYLLGQEVAKRPDITRRIVTEGHTLGNHTYHHPDLAKIDDQRVFEEISKTQNIIYEITGHYPLTYRPPYGSSRAISPRYPMDEIMWSVDSQDWKIQDINQIIESTTKDVKSGDIILFHDTYGTTVDAIPQVITKLQEKGFTLVTVEDLLVDNLRLKYQPSSSKISSRSDVTN